MSGNFGDYNPYTPPSTSFPSAYGPVTPPPNVSGKVLPPAIVLTIVGVLGIGFSLFNAMYALQEPKVDPNAPPFLQEIQKNSFGPTAAIVQSVFVVVNAFIILGAIQMMRMKTWGLAVAATIVAMLNFGSLCCVLGLPIGIWSLVVLMMDDVKRSFSWVRRRDPRDAN